MKNTIFIILLFGISYFIFYKLGSLLFKSDVNPNSLMAAVTFGGVNYLALFVYFLLSIISTLIVFFSIRSKMSTQKN